MGAYRVVLRTAMLCSLLELYSTATAYPPPPPITPAMKAAALKSGALSATPALGDFSIIHITDTHSWIAGHAHGTATGMKQKAGEGGADVRDPPKWVKNVATSRQDADYGDLVSFHARIMQEAERQKKDVFLLNSGDIVDGTGLSNLSPVNGRQLLPLLTKVPFDALGIGNHELYQSATVGNMVSSGFVQGWGGRYITSNVRHNAKDGGAPLGSKFRVVKGKFGTSILVLGFMYEMRDHCDYVAIDKIKDVVAAAWFATAMQSTVKAIVVLAHMDLQDPLTKAILAGIRNFQPDTPVMFLTGHTHYRGYDAKMARRAVSIESGHYFSTIGFLSVTVDAASGDPTFGQSWVDTNKLVMAKASLGAAGPACNGKASCLMSKFATPQGAKLSKDILAVRVKMGATRVLGCAPRHYSVLSCGVASASRACSAVDSLWGLYFDVARTQIMTPARNPKQIVIEKTGSLRYDLFAGPITFDDLLSLSPFGNKYVRIAGINGDLMQQLLAAMRTDRRSSPTSKPNYVVITGDDKGVQSGVTYELLCTTYDRTNVLKKLATLGAPKTAVAWRQTGKASINGTFVWDSFFETSKVFQCPKTAAKATAAAAAAKDGGSSLIIVALVLVGGAVAAALLALKKIKGDENFAPFEITQGEEQGGAAPGHQDLGDEF